MRRIELVHAVITAVLAPLSGLGLLGYLATQHALQSWHGGLVLALMFGPAIASDKMGAMAKRLERVSKAWSDEDPPPPPTPEPAPEGKVL